MRTVGIRGSTPRYANTYLTALALVASGQVDATLLVTRRFQLQDAAQAFATAQDGQSSAVKVIVDVGDR